MSDKPVGILFLDVEGGWGGSSRSLMYMVRHLDRRRFRPVVVSRKEGPVGEAYGRMGVVWSAKPDLPIFRPAERKNWLSLALYLWRVNRHRGVATELAELVHRHGVRIVHINHESLGLFGVGLARSLGLPVVAHVRTQLHPGFYSRMVCRRLERRARHLVFIVEPVKRHFLTLAGAGDDPDRHAVVFNITPSADGAVTALPELGGQAGRFHVLSLSNFSPNRGVDRVIEVAAALKARGDGRFVFHLFGRPANHHPLTGRPSPYYQVLKDRVNRQALGDMVLFPGHVAQPERALVGADALVKLTRQDNPWGRDIMEAMAFGLPVITLGAFQDYVTDGVNGFVDPAYDPERVADHLVRLADDPDLARRMAEAGRARAAALFDGPTQVGKLEAIYERILGST